MRRTYKRFGSVLSIMIAVSLLGGCGDDSSDGGNAGASGTGATGGGGGSGGTSGGGGGGGSGGTGDSGGMGGSGGMSGSGGMGGSGGGMPMFTEAECVAMTNTAMPDIPETCAPCLCGVDTGVALCNANCWTLIACASAACGDLPQAEQQGCVTTECGTEIGLPGAVSGASELGQAMMSCTSECGTGTDADAGN